MKNLILIIAIVFSQFLFIGKIYAQTPPTDAVTTDPGLFLDDAIEQVWKRFVDAIKKNALNSAPNPECKNELADINNCIKCLDEKGVYTAIGCVDPSPLGLITRTIQTAFATLGGVVLIQLIVVGIKYQSGDVKKIEESKQEIFSTISAIFILIFSVLIVNIIGTNILDVIPKAF